jgi:NAD(P)-dependent dehydrogenase (short-subunit alcohol dehydrogenase family)
MPEQFSLTGKTIFITGASSGIGKQTAIDLSAAGARLVITGRNEARINETFHSLTGEGHTCFVADMLDFDSFGSIAENLPLLNGIVHSAGVTGHLPAKFIAADDISQMMQINYMAPVLLTSALLKKKKVAANASLVFLSSITTKYPYYGGALYGSSKAAIEAYSRVLSIELAAKGIRSNCISPSFVRTPMVDDAGKTISNEVLDKFEKMMPLGFGEPTDVSNAILYLLSDASKWVTGSNMVLGGG